MPRPRSAPLRSTYRLQLTPAFTLLDAAATIPDLRDLGVDAVYLSPVLQARSGSSHGYDVVDPTRVDADRGGAAGLESLTAAAHGAGLAVVVDIVPNHVGVAVPRENPAWWSLLERGRESPYADWFDVDWAAEAEGLATGRLRIPVLGVAIEAAAAAGDLRVVAGPDGAPELHYAEHAYPVAPGTGGPGDDAIAVHARQNYELVDWHRADDALNYRRFFAVNELAAVRVEDPAVFDATHVEILRWVREGWVDGLRVDHPDGLADPGGYLARLHAAVGPDVPVFVEKILEPGEELPSTWATVGTTGYDALAGFDRVLVDPAGAAPLDALEAELGGAALAEWPDTTHDTKRGIADGILGSEIRRLARDLARERPVDLPVERVVDALAEVAACFPVYRSYLPLGAEHLEHALGEAAHRRPDLADALGAVAPALGDPSTAVARRLQQTSGMVMAKGVEDTAFYRTSRLTALAEVGADPSEFALTPTAFHAAQQARLAAWPATMTTLSTHDTKRGEDTRARILAIAETPAEWAAFVGRRRASSPLAPFDDGVLENLLWQAFVGSWPRDRAALHGYAEKAAREAGDRTTWTAPDAAFEEAMHALVDSAFDDPAVRADLEGMVELLAPAGRSNGLALKLLQLTAPGVPDVYQGAELWERSLVDPDNRRPVDFGERRRLLAALDAGPVPPVDESGAAKLLVTSRALRLRRDRPELFAGYVPLPATGAAADHLLAADRGGAIPVVTRLPHGLDRAGGWRDTALPLAPGDYRDALTGTRHAVPTGGAVAAADLFAALPVALLVREPRA